MKHNMQVMTAAELEATIGGGFWADFLGGIGRFIDWGIDMFKAAGARLGEIYKAYHKEEYPFL